VSEGGVVTRRDAIRLTRTGVVGGMRSVCRHDFILVSKVRSLQLSQGDPDGNVGCVRNRMGQASRRVMRTVAIAYVAMTYSAATPSAPAGDRWLGLERTL
jgi:hypothetical protein